MLSRARFDFFYCYVWNSFGFQPVRIRGQVTIGSSWPVIPILCHRQDNVAELCFHFSLHLYCMVSVWHHIFYFSSLLAVCQTWRRTWDGSTCYGYLWKSNKGSVAWRNVWGKKDKFLIFFMKNLPMWEMAIVECVVSWARIKRELRRWLQQLCLPGAFWDILGPMQLFAFHKYNKIPLIRHPWGLVRCQHIEHFRLSDDIFADLSLYLDCVTNEKSI